MQYKVTYAKLAYGKRSARFAIDNDTISADNSICVPALVGHGLYLLGHMPQCAPA